MNPTDTGPAPPARPTLKERAVEELIRYLEVAGYLFVVLAALLFSALLLLPKMTPSCILLINSLPPLCLLILVG